MSGPNGGPVVVVGAGPAGLATARALLRRQIPVRLLDAAERVAEPWRQRHPELVLNTHRISSALPGLRFPAGTHAYPRRDEVVRYLEQYVDRLPVEIEWRTSLHRVERAAQGVVLHTSRGRIAARHAVLATGPDRVPHVPAFEGIEGASQRLRHASAFRRARDHEAEDVLVVGLGISGVDLCTHLLERTRGRLWISVRGGTVLIPRRVLGIPLQPLAVLSRFQSVAAQDRMTRAISRLVLGRPEDTGLPKAIEGPLARFLSTGQGPPTDDGFLRAVAEGRIGVVPEIERLDHATVHLRGGPTLRPDRIFAATGYRAGLEAWLEGLDVLDETGRPRACGVGLPECPGLWFAGLRSGYHGNLYLRGVEAKHIARGIERALARRDLKNASAAGTRPTVPRPPLRSPSADRPEPGARRLRPRAARRLRGGSRSRGGGRPRVDRRGC